MAHRTVRDSKPYGLARAAYRQWFVRRRQTALFNRRLVEDYLARHSVACLHLGCGQHLLDGWLNSDFDAEAHRSVLCMDAGAPFPTPADSFDFIFSEHMIEHLTPGGAVVMIGECYRTLKPGGILRLSTPPLEFLLQLATEPGPEHQRYMEFHLQSYSPDAPIKSRATIVADYYRQWGHRFIYDREGLTCLVQQAGFQDVTEVALNQSAHAQLAGLENEGRMPDGLLALSTMTFEATKPNLPSTVEE